jgi:host factor-I protein
VLGYLKVHATIPQLLRAMWPSKRDRQVVVMKEAMDSSLAGRPLQQEGFANRKLIRPTLNRFESRVEHPHSMHGSGERVERIDRPERAEKRDHNERADRNDHANVNGRGDRSNAGARKVAPPEQTNAENFYYQKQMQSKTPMVIVLRDGEQIHGVIEWYDKACLKVNRSDSPNVMIYKPAIKYMYKEGENKKDQG